MISLLLGVVMLVSCLLTFFIRRFAVKKQLLDIPNERSAHSQPTPRGGGLAIVVSFLLPLFGVAMLYGDSTALVAVIGVAAGMVACIGWLDDHGHVQARWRLLVHAVAGVLLIAFLGAVTELQVGSWLLPLGGLGIVITLVAIVWVVNLFNFMDGIDGLTAMETIFVSVVMACFIWWLQGSIVLFWMWLLLAAATVGFFVWNFPVAKIFMGDVGSGFLGLTVAALMLASVQHNPLLLWSGLIVLGVFIVDATMTLSRRALAREAVHQAHSSHAYQHAARRFNSHSKVTQCVFFINLCWLLPLAFAVVSGWLGGVSGLLIAYTPLLILGWYLKAGCK